MMFSFILLVCLATVNCGVEVKKKADAAPKQHVSCIRTFKKIGCFKQSSSPSMTLLIDDEDPDSPFNAGYLYDMVNFQASTHSLACRCAEQAMRQGYSYFSIRFWGRCYVGRDFTSVTTMLDDKETHSSAECSNPSFQTCNDDHHHECAGSGNADYIYDIYGGSTDDPNIDGGYTAWSDWTTCSEQCGEGIETRERACTNPLPKGTGKSCNDLGESSETRPCKIKECQIDGGWNEWSKFTVCTRSCGGGVSRRERICGSPYPRNGGALCTGPNFESRGCQPDPCPIDGGYSQWSQFGACTATCGLGEKTRTRLCNEPAPQHGGRTCAYLGNAEEKSSCNIKPCPIDGGFTAWGAFTQCTVTCGTGERTRARICSNPEPAYGGRACAGPFESVEDCNTDPCPVNGGWSAYNAWSTCTVSCGGGLTHRRRTCTNPAPDHGGDYCQGKHKDSKTCNTNDCPIPGGFTEWSEFEECSKSCGGGIKARTRTCTNPEPQHGGASCTGATTNTARCNARPCPIDGGYSNYGNWVKCTKSCGGGKQFRTRTCTAPRPQYGGDDCALLGEAKEWRDCETQECARYTRFSRWSTCSTTCGGGTQRRTRTCYAPDERLGVDCSHLGADFETRACETQNCPINGAWSAWTPWTECTRSCGQGSKRKSRTCNNPAPQYGGRGCPGNKFIIAHCNVNPCPIDGRWTAWSEYGTCSEPCGGGVHRRNRQCSNPTPKHGGNSCAGDSFTTQACNIQSCAIDGEWTAWSPWRPCTRTCGGGQTYRTHRCINPRPQNGGDYCVGAPILAKQCGTIPCPINGQWSAFREFGECSVSCGGGSEVSVRYCDSPSPLYNGNACPGDRQRTRACNARPCPIDGSYSEWSAFSECSFSCDGGTQTRTRTCTPPQHGGDDCSVLGSATDVRECNTQACPIEHYHTAHACAGRYADITCAEGKGKIHVLSAGYGRWKNVYCGNVAFWSNNCGKPSNETLTQVADMCEFKTECRVPAADVPFGNPCPGVRTFKYVEVMYQCYGGRYPELG